MKKYSYKSRFWWLLDYNDETEIFFILLEIFKFWMGITRKFSPSFLENHSKNSFSPIIKTWRENYFSTSFQNALNQKQCFQIHTINSTHFEIQTLWLKYSDFLLHHLLYLNNQNHIVLSVYREVRKANQQIALQTLFFNFF